MGLAARRLGPAILALGAVGCFDFQPSVPDTPAPLAVGRYTNVQVEYRQPNGCENAPVNCDQLVVFFGSWMRAGQEIYMQRDPGSHAWTGTVTNVPVNWPPTDEPHFVRVFDPHLVETPTGGVTAARLFVGGQLLTVYDQPGTTKESGLVYVDDNGVGHNPY
jgi:hypothetical protein